MSDIEGAICDECGSRVGPHGCCSDARRTEARANAAIYHNGELRGEIETYRKVISEWKQRAEVSEFRLSMAIEALIWLVNVNCGKSRTGGDSVSLAEGNDALDYAKGVLDQIQEDK